MDPILLVDDEIDNLDALRRLLRSDYEVVTAATPAEALKEVVTRTFHVVVSDQRMPEMTGVELLEKVKGVQPHAVRILLTGYTDVESVIGAINLGQIYRYIAKPWDPEELRLTLRQANEAYRLRTELERKNQELAKALKEIQGLDAAKNRFLSLVSHELNTPLTVVTSFVPLLKEFKTTGDTKKAVEAIDGATHRLANVVREVVDFVRIESSPTIQRGSIEIGSVLKEAMAKTAEKAKSKTITIKYEGDLTIVFHVDRTRMELALEKVLEDCIQQAPKNSQVVIVAQNSDSGVILRFCRGGLALSTQAFGKLEFGGDPLKHQHNLGLGLALFKAIIEAHGGELRATSNQQFPAIIEISLPVAA